MEKAVLETRCPERKREENRRKYALSEAFNALLIKNGNAIMNAITGGG